MGNASSVFQADVVRVFSIARLFHPLCELTWGAIAQTAMRPLLVVILPPITNLSPSVEQVLKPTYPQAFVSQFSVEAFHLRVLRRLARLRICTSSICCSKHHDRKCRLVSSGPLSQRIDCGLPRPTMISSSTRVTRRLAKLVSTSSARHSLS